MVVHDAETPNVGDKRLEATSDWRMSSSCAEKTLSADDDVELSSEVSFISVLTSICMTLEIEFTRFS